MTGRDRIVVIGLAVLAILAGAWIVVVSPERQQASKLDAQVSAAKSQLASAQGKLADARTAQAQYATAYASMVSLGKAVPPKQEVASLIYQLSRATGEKNVSFPSIVTGASAAGTPAATPTTTTAGFSQMPFTFVFEGGFFDLEHLFRQLTSFTTRSPAGKLLVSGRLLTVQSVKLAPTAGTGTVQNKGANSLTGTVSATAYVLPSSQGASATPASPAPAATPTASTAAPSSPTAPAIVKVNP